MAVVSVDPSILGAFDPEDIVLEHDDTVPPAFWNTYVENGATSYCMWKPVISNSGSTAIADATYYGCIAPTNASAYWQNWPYIEKATFRFYVECESGRTGKISISGGTDLASLSTLVDRWSFTTGTLGTYAGTVALPKYYLDAGVTKAYPYFLKVLVEANPTASKIYHMHLWYTKYPVASAPV